MRRVTVWSIVLLGIALVGLMMARGAGFAAVGRRPLPLEEPGASLARRFLTPTALRTTSNPVPATDDVLKEAREHWADHCATCHGNDGSGDTSMGHRMFPRVPDMRGPRTQSQTDGELFYAIEQGVPWTGMPGWTTGTPEGERASWALVRFIRHLPALTADELTDMERLNPKSAADADREREIEDFLHAPAKKDATPAPQGRRGGGPPHSPHP